LIIAGRGAGIDREQKRAMKKKPPPSLCCLQGGGNVLDWRQVPGCMELEFEGEVTAEHFPSRNNVLMKWEPLEEVPAFCFCTCPLK